jgi:hypothetical protein
MFVVALRNGWEFFPAVFFFPLFLNDKRKAAHDAGGWRTQALAQACAVCSPKTKVNECNGDFSPIIFTHNRCALFEQRIFQLRSEVEGYQE